MNESCQLIYIPIKEGCIYSDKEILSLSNNEESNLNADLGKFLKFKFSKWKNF